MATSAYELLAAYVSFTERGSAQILAAIDKLRAAMLGATGKTHHVNVDSNIPKTTESTRGMNAAFLNTKKEAENVRRILSGWTPPVEATSAQMVALEARTRRQAAAVAAVAAAANTPSGVPRDPVTGRFTSRGGAFADQARARVASEREETFSLGQLAVAAGKTAAAMYVLNKAREFTAVGLRESISRESDRVSLEQLTGSAEKARDVLTGIKDLADRSIFSFPDLRESATRMIAMGTASEKVVDRLTRLAAITSATGGNISSIIRQYSQAQGIGTLRAEDLVVLEENNFPVYRLLAELTGRSRKELRALGEQGLLSFQLLEEAIDKATNKGGQFFGVLEKGSETVKGRLEAITDVTRNIAGNLAEWKVFNFSQELDGLRRILNDVEDATKTASEAAGKAPANFNEKLSAASRFRIVDLFTSGASASLRLVQVVNEENERLDKLANAAKNAKQAIDDATNSATKAIDTGGTTNALDRAEAEKKLADAVKAGAEQGGKALADQRKEIERLVDAQRNAAESLRDSLMSPLESFGKEIRDAGELFFGGFIDKNTLDRAIERASRNLTVLQRQFDTISSKNNGFNEGTTQAFTFRLEATRQQEQLLSESKRGNDNQARANAILGEIRDGIDKIVKKPAEISNFNDSEIFN